MPIAIGRRYGKLVVLGPVTGFRKRGKTFHCRCDCGEIVQVTRRLLLRGDRTSCGCTGGRLKHGMFGTPEYQLWANIKDRCYNENHQDFNRYGGRGIRVCEEWVNSFEAFYAYIGLRPSPAYSLDRFPDNDGNYEPGNVRWATDVEQNNHRGKYNVWLTIGKESKTLAQWSRVSSRSAPCIRARLNRGLSADEAVFGPLRSTIAKHRRK